MIDLPGINHNSRLRDVRQAMSEHSIENFLTIDGVSLRWLSGFTGSAGKLLIGGSSNHLLTDGRYADQASREISGTDIELFVGDGKQQREFIVARMRSSKALTLEADRITWGAVEELKAEVEADVLPSNGLISDLRQIKDPAEVARIEAAASIADNALAQLLPNLSEQPTELEFARALDTAMLDLGAEALSFETICASGPNAAAPHARPSSRVIRARDLVVIDFGAVIDGYHSDMTRTYIVGDTDQSSWDMVNSVTEAQERGCEVVGPGVKACDVDEACRSHLSNRGLGEYFVHGTGHGVGLEIHEAPWINGKSSEVLEESHVVTVEPGVYLPGVGGVRVEDTVLITSSGFRRLTSAPKDSIV